MTANRVKTAGFASLNPPYDARWAVRPPGDGCRRVPAAARGCRCGGRNRRTPRRARGRTRSEEHTSELQSQSNLVCRLLLEKKKREHVGYNPLHIELPRSDLVVPAGIRDHRLEPTYGQHSHAL